MRKLAFRGFLSEAKWSCVLKARQKYLMNSWGFPRLGVPFRGPNNKDYSILGSILGSPHFGKLPDLKCLAGSSLDDYGTPCSLGPELKPLKPSKHLNLSPEAPSNSDALEKGVSASLNPKPRYYSKLQDLRTSEGTWDRDFRPNETSYQAHGWVRVSFSYGSY